MDISNYLSSLINSGKSKSEIASILDEELNKAVTNSLKRQDYADDALLALNNYYTNFGDDSYEEDMLYDIYPTSESFIDFLNNLAQARFEIPEEKPCSCDKASVSPTHAIITNLDKYYTEHFPDSYTSGDIFDIYPDEKSFTKYLDSIYQSFLVLKEYGDKGIVSLFKELF